MNEIGDMLKDFNDYTFTYTKEEIATLLFNFELLSCKYESLRDMLFEHLSVTTSLDKEELFAELESKTVYKFRHTWADFVVQHGVPPKGEHPL